MVSKFVDFFWSFLTRVKVISFLYGVTIRKVTLTIIVTNMDLVPHLDSELSFGHNMFIKVSDDLNTFGFIVRNSKLFSNMKAFLPLCFKFVKSKLEYTTLILSPFYKCLYIQTDVSYMEIWYLVSVSTVLSIELSQYFFVSPLQITNRNCYFDKSWTNFIWNLLYITRTVILT